VLLGDFVDALLAHESTDSTSLRSAGTGLSAIEARRARASASRRSARARQSSAG
jgi:hypothetical protein